MRKSSAEMGKAMRNQIFEEVCNDVIPYLKRIPDSSTYVIALGGSYGKGISDKYSDFDFRVYYEKRVSDEAWKQVRAELNVVIDKWKLRGIEIDGAWSRSIDKINNDLDSYLAGELLLEEKKWSIWGYQLLTDLYHQILLDDPVGVGAEWMNKLKTFSPTLKKALLTKYLGYIEYWANDYHYVHKIAKKDIVFLHSLVAKLVHSMMQVLYAINEYYYPGDGYNLYYVSRFHIKPINLEERVESILYPQRSDSMYENQFTDLMGLLHETINLAENTLLL